MISNEPDTKLPVGIYWEASAKQKLVHDCCLWDLSGELTANDWDINIHCIQGDVAYAVCVSL